MIRQHAADRSNTKHDSADAGINRFTDRHLGDAQLDGACVELHLSGTLVTSPLDDAGASLRVHQIRAVAQEDQVGRLEADLGRHCRMSVLRICDSV